MRVVVDMCASELLNGAEREEWRPVKDWEGLYEVSNLGRVRRIERTVMKRNGQIQVLPEMILACNPDNRGYAIVKFKDGARKGSARVYRLVAEAFVENSENHQDVIHINGIKNDDRAVNLQWATIKQRHTEEELENLPGEEWRDVVGYEGLYQVSSLGRVKSLPRSHCKGTLLVQRPNHQGYPMVALYKNGKMSLKSVHRLVAIAFLDNSEGLPAVNHKDECKTNNAVSNLEWCTNSYNNHYNNGYARRAASHNYKESAKKAVASRDQKAINEKIKKPVIQLDLDGSFIKWWPGIIDIKHALGLSDSNGSISGVCNGKNKTAYGYLWVFEEDYNAETLGLLGAGI